MIQAAPALPDCLSYWLAVLRTSHVKPVLEARRMIMKWEWRVACNGCLARSLLPGAQLVGAAPCTSREPGATARGEDGRLPHRQSECGKQRASCPVPHSTIHYYGIPIEALTSLSLSGPVCEMGI